MDFNQLQTEVSAWSQRNFGIQPPLLLVLGVCEEAGELAHAHLKSAQGIRTNEDHRAAAKDAVGDCVIYLADYCASMGFNLQIIVEETWAKVKLRDWKKNPATGDENV